ncbi:MAG: GlxA family transcriptional regulator [Sphingomonadales bacterium]|nr:GlxA family transcriptional regulator [Sphingomonadales bacterium]
MRRFVFLLVPDFSMMAFTAAVEPLRAANRMSGTAHYAWQTVTLDGGPVSASNGVRIMPDAAIAAIGEPDAIVVCGGINVEQHVGSALYAPLRKADRRGVALGAVCTGSVVLAKAGLLDGHRCTIHWEDVASFSENFPTLDVSTRLFEIDGRRFTCSGGTAPLDLMIHFIELDFGHELSVMVAEQMLHHLTRKASQPQRLALAERTGVRHPGLLEAISQMEEHLEQPIDLAVIADRAGMSMRQLERLSASFLGMAPARYYLGIRLDRARHLVTHTAMPLAEVALACGFSSSAHFSRRYRESFSISASRDRRQSTLSHRLGQR